MAVTSYSSCYFIPCSQVLNVFAGLYACHVLDCPFLFSTLLTFLKSIFYCEISYVKTYKNSMIDIIFILHLEVCQIRLLFLRLYLCTHIHVHVKRKSTHSFSEKLSIKESNYVININTNKVTICFKCPFIMLNQC